MITHAAVLVLLFWMGDGYVPTPLQEVKSMAICQALADSNNANPSKMDTVEFSCQPK